MEIKKQIGSGSCMSRNKIHALGMEIDTPLQITAAEAEEKEGTIVTYDPVVKFLDDDTDEEVIKKLVQEVFDSTLQQGTIRENKAHNNTESQIDKLTPDLLNIICKGLSHLDVASLRQTSSSLLAMLPSQSF
jgi:hypothetical protein